MLFIALLLAVQTNVFACEMVVSPESGEAPMEVTFNISQEPGITVIGARWDFGDGETSNIPYPFLRTHIYKTPGQYTPVYSYDIDQDSDDTDQDRFECSALVNVTQVLPFGVNIEASPLSGSTPLGVFFNADVKSGTFPLTYTWDFGDGSQLEAQKSGSHYHLYKTPGEYQARVMVTDATGTTVESKEVVITVYDALDCKLTVDKTDGYAGMEVNFYLVVKNGRPPYLYEFDFGDGRTMSRVSPEASHTYTAKGVYTAKVSVSDSTGLYGEADQIITVVDTQDKDQISADLLSLVSRTDAADSSSSLIQILDEGKGSVDGAIAPLHNAPILQKREISQIVQDKVERLVGSTALRVGYFEEQGTATAESVDDVKSRVGGILSSMARNDVAITGATARDAASLSDRSLSLKLRKILIKYGLSEAEADALLNNAIALRAFFSKHPEVFALGFEASVLKLDVKKSMDRLGIQQASQALGLSTELLPKLQAAIPEVTDVNRKIRVSDQGIINYTILDFFHSLLGYEPSVISSSVPPLAGVLDGNSSSSGDTLVVDSSVDPLTGIIQLTLRDGVKSALAIPRLGMISEKLGQGIHLLHDGSLVGIQNELGFSLYPTAMDQVGIASEIINTFGMTPKFSDKGKLSVDYGEGILSLGMGWAINTGPAALRREKMADERSVCFHGLRSAIHRSSIGTVGFTGSGGTETASYAYSILVEYPDGSFQGMPPMVMAEDELLTILTVLLPGLSSINRETGVLSIDLWDLKPDYLFTPLTDIDYAAIEMNNGFLYGDAAFEFEDCNGDGLIDVKYYSHSPLGVQILFTAI